jgi:hypothetical protein
MFCLSCRFDNQAPAGSVFDKSTIGADDEGMKRRRRRRRI